MTILQAAMLGIVQGLTEFLPISSSGHLIIFPQVFGWEPQSMTFDITVHVATLGAIFAALRADISKLIRGVLRRDRSSMRLMALIVVATIPAVIVGGLYGEWFEGFRTIRSAAMALIVWGVVLALADRYADRVARTHKLETLSWHQALFVGIVQIFAFIPGTSRSGSTMSAGLLAGMDREAAAKFSFFIAIPAIAGAGLLTGADVAEAGLDVGLAPLLAGAVAAFLSGVFAIRFLLFVVKKANFLWFAGYRIVLGLLLLIFLA